MRIPRSAPWLALGVIVLGALAWAAWPGAAPTPGARANDLASEIRCPDCEGLSVADSSTLSARAIRVEIRELIEGGRSDAEIRQVYVDRFNESILLDPQGGGLGVLVWGLPVVALIAGAGGLALAMRRWRREPRMPVTAADEQLVATVRQSGDERR